jgi:hypothetical protein
MSNCGEMEGKRNDENAIHPVVAFYIDSWLIPDLRPIPMSNRVIERFSLLKNSNDNKQSRVELTKKGNKSSGNKKQVMAKPSGPPRH